MVAALNSVNSPLDAATTTAQTTIKITPPEADPRRRFRPFLLVYKIDEAPPDDNDDLDESG